MTARTQATGAFATSRAVNRRRSVTPPMLNGSSVSKVPIGVWTPRRLTPAKGERERLKGLAPEFRLFCLALRRPQRPENAEALRRAVEATPDWEAISADLHFWCKPAELNRVPLAYRARPSPFGLACVDGAR
jgi:hypothetical protein